MYTETHFRNMLDSMSQDQIRAVVDVAEGFPSMALNWWLRDALVKRNFVYSGSEVVSYVNRLIEVGVQPNFAYIEGLTEFGKAWVAWYRAPRDVPQQGVLF